MELVKMVGSRKAAALNRFFAQSVVWRPLPFNATLTYIDLLQEKSVSAIA